MNVYKVIGWTDFHNEEYPPSGWSVAIDYAVIAELKEKGYRFGGDAHQMRDGCCPVMNDGTRALYSPREWGALMATALGIEGEYAYMEWYSDCWTRSGIVGENGVERRSVYPAPAVDRTLISEKLRGREIRTMHLDDDNYRLVESGEKTVEVRLNDAKRRAVEAGDILVFFCFDGEMKITVTEVVKVHRFDSFGQLFASGLAELAGFGGLSVDEAVKRMYKYYTEEDEKKYGVVGLEVKLLSE